LLQTQQNDLANKPACALASRLLQQITSLSMSPKVGITGPKNEISAEDSMSRSLFAGLLLLALVTGVSASSTLYIGNDTNGPVTVYDSNGNFLQNFGQGGATGSAINAAGDVWTVAPSFGNNNIVEYSPTQTVLNSFVEGVNGQWIEDMSHGLGSTLWVSTFEGNVFSLNDQTGAVLSTFSVAGTSYTGIAFDGTNLWVSGGLTTPALYLYSTSGALLNTIALGTTCGGVGYDVSDGTLWCGGSGVMNHYDTSGNLLGSFSTALGNYHDGVETLNRTSTTTPEPASLLLVGTGLAALCTRLRKLV
jgi:hypothetical protein